MSTHDSVRIPRADGHFIGGKTVAPKSGATFENRAPATDEVLGPVASGDRNDVAAAVEAANEALDGPWATWTAAGRAELLRKIGDRILENRENLARLEALDTGKPLTETRGGDIPRAAANFHFFADLCAHQGEPSYGGADGSRHVTVREPIGVVGLITPWNLPLYLSTWKLAPALAQGNAVILKPAELTPLSAMALTEILQEAGTPPGVVNVVQGFGADAAGEGLIEHPEVKAISFTGETLTGSAIMKTAAPHLKKLSFELGGKGASVVFADADLDKAAAATAKAAFRNQGQICLAGSRLIVAESVADEFMERVLRHVHELQVGHPLEETTTFGSLVSRDHRDKVKGYVDWARNQPGLEIVTGGGIPEGFDKGAYFAPTIIRGVEQDSKLIQEEIFGPVLTVQTFREFDEAMALLNGTPYGLSCSVWSRDIHTAQNAAKRAATGLVWVNCWFSRNLHTAFGGMKRSGVGREGGQYSLDFFSEMKTLTFAP